MYVRTNGIEWIRRVKQKEKRHKVVYTTASVAYRWAGAVMRFRYLSGKSLNSVTNQLTDGWTDGLTD